MPDNHITNLLDLKPRRTLTWENRENGLVTLIVPKFRNRFVVRWIVPLLAKPNIKIHLDDLGSFVWRKADGETPVGQIAQEMADAFGEPVEQLYDRIGLFLSRLEKERFVELAR